MKFNHVDKFLQLGLNISFYRKLRGMTQLQLSEKVGISRTHLSRIEASNIPTPISLGVLFDLADALQVTASKLLEFRE